VNWYIYIQDYLTCDLKLPDTTLNDLFSEFDVNTNDFQCFDGSTNDVNYSQSTPDLSLAYNTTLHPIATNNNTQNPEPVSYEIQSQNAFKSLVEHYQKQQQSNSKLSSLPSNYIATDYHEVIKEKIFVVYLFFFYTSVFIDEYVQLSIGSNHYYKKRNNNKRFFITIIIICSVS